MLASLPTEIASGIAAWLLPWDVRSLVFASKCLLHSPLHDVYVRHHVRLRIPPDPQHCEQLVAACKSVLATSRPLPVRTMLGFSSQLQVLKTIGIQDSIEDIAIDARRVFQYPIPKSVWNDLAGLSCFRRLVQLTLASCGGPVVDIEILARAAPMLEIFSAARLTLSHEDAFAAFRYLRRLGFCLAKLHSLRFASCVTLLEHVTCDSLSFDAQDTIDFSTCFPLKVLDVERCPELLERLIRAIEQTHLPVLEKLRLVCPSWTVNATLDLTARPSPHLRELAIPPSTLRHGIRVLTPMTQLRKLHLWWDMPARQPVVHFRALVRLRELRLIDGWLRDFVDCLPQLEKLSVGAFSDLSRQRTFQQRDGIPSDARSPRLRDVSIGEHVELNDYAMELIGDVRSFKYRRKDIVWNDVFRVNELPHLTSLKLKRESSCYLMDDWNGETQTLACIHSLEALHLNFCQSLLKKLPWSLEGAARLRVIKLYNVDQQVLETIATWAHTLSRLEEFHLDRFRGQSLAPLLAFHGLRIVGIGCRIDCRRLRSARGAGGPLPNLTTILHNGSDCAWHATCALMAQPPWDYPY